MLESILLKENYSVDKCQPNCKYPSELHSALKPFFEDIVLYVAPILLMADVMAGRNWKVDVSGIQAAIQPRTSFPDFFDLI